MTWRDALDRIVRRLNVPGIELLAKEPSEWELAADADEVIIKAKLDSVFGEFRVDGRALASVDHRAVSDVFRQRAEDLRAKLRGRLLVEILNGEWSMSPNDADLQLMERASLRLMSFVDKHKEKA